MDEPRVSIRAKVCANAIVAAGVDRVVTLDLHAAQIQGFFDVPVDDLHALPVLADAIAAEAIPNLVVVSPDAGFASQARGATGVFGAVTHALLTEAGHQRLAASPIEKIFVTDSVETQPIELPDSVEVISVAGLLGEAVRRIAAQESVSVLFN